MIKDKHGVDLDTVDLLALLPEWKDKYSKMGVTPRELYMRQNGLCWLIVDKMDDETTIYCTDGVDKAPTDAMLNPTIECVKCIICFSKKFIDGDNKENTGE